MNKLKNVKKNASTSLSTTFFLLFWLDCCTVYVTVYVTCSRRHQVAILFPECWCCVRMDQYVKVSGVKLGAHLYVNFTKYQSITAYQCNTHLNAQDQETSSAWLLLTTLILTEAERVLSCSHPQHQFCNLSH